MSYREVLDETCRLVRSGSRISVSKAQHNLYKHNLYKPCNHRFRVSTPSMAISHIVLR